MPFGYFFSVGLVALATAVALINPRPPHTTPSYWGHWLSFMVNEQPFIAFYLLAASTLLAYGQGDLDSPAALVAVAVAVVTVGGLAVLVVRASGTDRAVGVPPGGRPWARILLAPWVVRRRDVKRVANLAYGDAGKRNRLDVYHRRDRPAGAPVLVFFHGGGFRMGSKNREARAMLNELAGRGFVCVNANYRLAPAAAYPDYLIDAKRVIAWVRAHIADYGGDSRTVVSSGSSAGANLSAMLGLTPGDMEFQPGFEGADCSVSAVIGFGGYYGRSAGPGSSPVERVADAPPFLLLHGTNDGLTLIEDTRDFADKLRAVSTNPVTLVELPGAQHSFDLLWSLRYSYVIDAVAEYLAGRREL
ncbi:alpha/beta hydrolase [Actinoplanes sp. Pm04-4]|uniref:Alpha/beta hydrolase n=1 Tax=Paractinoplanes pyxinae TaxID=2997416 RepID=A0ABT4B9Q7_9ACTN|nr:alpha/beta hydrolase [Actinoplanes pyxinae]MCY1143234.1 alpha/beta hydrolase [Actinoplanes pyxinae]